MAEPFAQWVILELLGHRRLAGFLTEQQIAGASFLRIDVPGPKICECCGGAGMLSQDDAEGWTTDVGECPDCHGLKTEITATQFYAPASVYAITPTDEGIARTVAALNAPAPVKRWELPPSVRGDVDEDGGPW
jgi:hypothetical protein